MATQAGVGFSRLPDSGDAARQALSTAVDALDGADPALALIFATAAYDQNRIHATIAEQLPNVPISGCTGEGVIAFSDSHEGELAIGVMLIASDQMQFESIVLEGYDIDSPGCGDRIAKWLSAWDDVFGLLIFPDGLVGNCSQFLSHLQQQLPDHVRVSGGTSADAMTFDRTYQYGTDRVVSSGIAAVAVRGRGRFEVAISHGCAPIGLERTVTRAENGWVFEIDDQRAWSVFKEYLDGDPEDLNGEGIVHLCIGEKLPPLEGEAYAPYLIHTPLSLNKETGALFFPSGGLQTGDKIQLTRRDPDRIRASARACADRLAEAASKQPSVVLQFDCAGRGQVLFGGCAAEQIVRPLQEALGETTPWLGFHTYGEIGPIGEQLYYHNYTVSLCALYDEESA